MTASLCGFYSANYFNNYFYGYYGFTPGKARKSNLLPHVLKNLKIAISTKNP
jgi:AraC-like DNA-binding protein